ncbi:MAG: hypothetical protein ACXWUG_24655 [Polyangiales bacterium]
MRVLLTCVLLTACSAGSSHSDESGRKDASLGDSDSLEGGASFDSGTGTDAGDIGVKDGGPSCADGSLDMKGCVCPTAGATRDCFSGDVSNRSVGLCKDGKQTCIAAGEFNTWGACMGDVLPAKEVCTDMLDHDCNHLLGCKDPSCATAPSCTTVPCKDGDTRDCYTGPAGTLGVGTCKPGKQTCSGGKWSGTCTGEVLPTAEHCDDPLDHNCNHWPGCLDIFFCATNPACQEPCKKPLDPGCVCAEGSGDTATCPKGYHAVSGGPVMPNLECCPCAVKDCGDPNCCGEALCKGDPKCGMWTCHDLPASCGGKVSADCDDFPEDCDEPCCECYGDCSGA